jgi:hypothetical protein
MRHERFWINTIFLTALACSRETPAPPSRPVTPAPTTTTAAAPVAPVAVAKAAGSYDEAMLWLQSAPAFHFVVDEGGVHAEGELARRTVGAQSVQFRANGEEWRATSGARGVTWERRKGAAWATASAPAYGNRLYQRVTLAFDPQKKEGAAQLVGTEGSSSHYRFTNANTGEVHDVWVRTADNHVERIRIGDVFEMKLNGEQPKR